MADHPLVESDLNSLLDHTFLESVRFFSETDSTNRQAIRLLSEGGELATPCLVHTESQTAGKGRGSNRWWSQPGSLTFSVIVDLQQYGLSPAQRIQLPLLTGLAVLRTGQTFVPYPAGQDFALKWPNDVYLAGRKLAGILIEIPASRVTAPDSAAVHAVIGVGLNVNNSWAVAPQDLREKGISLCDHSSATFDRVKILKVFLGHLEQLIRGLSQGRPVLEGWSEHCLLTGKHVVLLVGEEEVSGDCLGLAPNGSLMMETADGPRQFMGGIVTSWSSC